MCRATRKHTLPALSRAPAMAFPGRASITGPEKGGGPTDSHAYRDAGGAGPLGGRLSLAAARAAAQGEQGASRLAESTPSTGEKRCRGDVPPGHIKAAYSLSNRT